MVDIFIDKNIIWRHEQMNYTLKQIFEETGVQVHRLKRVLSKHRPELDLYTCRGKRNRIEINENGKKILIDLCTCTRLTCSPEQETHSPVHLNSDLNTYTQTCTELVQVITDLKSELREEQIAHRESQKRSDTIIMSLTNRLEDIQKRLPAPDVIQERKVDKKSLWSKFCKWLNEVPERTN